MDKAEPITSTSMQLTDVTDVTYVTAVTASHVAEYPAVITKRMMHIIISIPLSW